MVAATFGSNDQILAPGVFGAWPQRYRWPVPSHGAAAFATVRRHLAMRRVNQASGAIRQRTYIDQDRSLARRLAKTVDYRVTHLVTAQAWLPWLDEIGALGGRTFDVVMSRYPFREIHRLLDDAAAEIGPSATIADFRAADELVEREAELLARARRIYTPHCGIASLFPNQVVQLAWHKPIARPRKPGDRVAFLGPTIARQRPDIARQLSAQLKNPLVVFGSTLEPLWNGMAVEPRNWGPQWLDGIGAILHPAAITHQPRALLKARAAGVTIYATETCGLDPSDYLPLDAFSAARQLS